ncbi:hypothetical protein EIN_143750 [Entamoeba invadens IP1]|uniref:Helitron helicase-like domain-containing protein n=1 Tax=Entamoeba invadens IP1 TaxID=370355 RepID=A0A0A1U957_ENTIV|nr:hypothetical protein EIN_143750 [Entamoeba invadens IP1]ELP91475.1 hypothetical protein EIN_143750 [Entamoeba invadens IP1]|eukprot:XP_004258246.1 hypothetical protein EIN_143750 [Entamoeba invadens IP1]
MYNLTQQFMVDAYARVESATLNYYQTHQHELRSMSYNGVRDQIVKDPNKNTKAKGQKVILPATYSNSPRNLGQKCADAMAIFAKFGPPDLFITFTANPNWREIKENLEKDEVAIDRPDLVTRVFKLKLDQLIKEITKWEIFGNVIAWVYRIEFQKRGLPHAHILIVLDFKSKLKTVDCIDRVICAEFTDNEEVKNLVKKHMVHGPCGDYNKNAVCMENDKCIKYFPKPLCDETTLINGYPIYRRRQSSTVKIGKYQLDNSWVVPFNPYLLKRFRAHINVECCSGVESIKYI